MLCYAMLCYVMLLSTCMYVLHTTHSFSYSSWLVDYIDTTGGFSSWPGAEASWIVLPLNDVALGQKLFPYGAFSYIMFFKYPGQYRTSNIQSLQTIWLKCFYFIWVLPREHQERCRWASQTSPNRSTKLKSFVLQNHLVLSILGCSTDLDFFHSEPLRSVSQHEQRSFGTSCRFWHVWEWRGKGSLHKARQGGHSVKMVRDTCFLGTNMWEINRLGG